MGDRTARRIDLRSGRITDSVTRKASEDLLSSCDDVSRRRSKGMVMSENGDEIDFVDLLGESVRHAHLPPHVSRQAIRSFARASPDPAPSSCCRDPAMSLSMATCSALSRLAISLATSPASKEALARQRSGQRQRVMCSRSPATRCASSFGARPPCSIGFFASWPTACETSLAGRRPCETSTVSCEGCSKDFSLSSTASRPAPISSSTFDGNRLVLRPATTTMCWNSRRHRVLFALGDVMGHGASTSPIYAMVRSQLHEFASSERRPHELLAHLHRHLRQHGHPNVFMTLTLLILDIESRTADFAVGGPPCPLVYSQGSCRPLTHRLGWTLGYPFEGIAFDSETIAGDAGRYILVLHGRSFGGGARTGPGTRHARSRPFVGNLLRPV